MNDTKAARRSTRRQRDGAGVDDGLRRAARMKKDSSLLGATGLRMTWVPVHLPDGRVRMEMRWRAPSVVTKQPAA
jgi:hypothetical protein